MFEVFSGRSRASLDFVQVLSVYVCLALVETLVHRRCPTIDPGTGMSLNYRESEFSNVSLLAGDHTRDLRFALGLVSRRLIRLTRKSRHYG